MIVGCHRGVFETAHGVGDNVRGRTLGSIDSLTFGSAESKSQHASLADRGRTEAETGMAHIYGYADPDVYRQELSRMPGFTGTLGTGNTTGTGPGTGDVRAGQDGPYGRDGRVDGGVGKGAGGYGTDDGYSQPGVQGLEQQQPAIDRNTQTGPVADGRGGLSPNRAPQNAGSEVGWTSVSQALDHSLLLSRGRNQISLLSCQLGGKLKPQMVTNMDRYISRSHDTSQRR